MRGGWMGERVCGEGESGFLWGKGLGLRWFMSYLVLIEEGGSTEIKNGGQGNG